MPNWCENYLIVTGFEEEIAKFKAAAQGYPPQFKDAACTAANTGECPKPEIEPLCFHSLLPVPERLLQRTFGGEEENAGTVSKLCDPDDNGHAWQTTNWGCKWGANVVAVDHQPELLAYDFDTPWSPPVALFATVSRRYHELQFRLEFREPGANFKGFVVINNGEIVTVARSECRVVKMAKSFNQVCRKLDAGREVTLHEEQELLPELHCGIDQHDTRMTVRRDGDGRHYICVTMDGTEREIAKTRSVDELRVVWQQIGQDPELAYSAVMS